MRFSRHTRLVCLSLASSTAFHGLLVGAVVALLMWVLLPAPPEGQQQPIVLNAVFSPASPAVPVETYEMVSEADLKIVVMPRSAEIRQHHYELTEAPASRPLPVVEAPRKPVAVAARPQPRLAPQRLPRWTPTLAATVPPQPAAAPPRRPTSSPSLPAVQAESVGQVAGPSPTAPKLIYSPPPLYPREAEVRRQEGTVRLWVQITVEGRVASVRIASSSGHGILDAAALRAVRNWRFEPARVDGRPIEVTRRYYVRFRL